MAWFSQAIEQVGNCHDRMGQKHARPGITHYFPDFFAVFQFIAMHQAFTAGGLVLLKRAMTQTLMYVCKELLAVMAKYPFCPVFIPAKTPEHHFHGTGFPLHAFC